MANIPFLNNAYFSAKVGIGTDTPDAKLEVKSSANLNSFVNITTTTDAYNSGISLRQSSNYGFDVYYTDDGVSPSVRGLRFDRVNNGSVANAMFIDRNSGNVGIGTTNPQNKLDVEQSTAVSARLLATGATSSSLKLEVKGGATQLTTTEILANSSGALTFATGTTSSTERMRIDSSGNVGIGTASPTQAKLVIDSDTAPQILVKNSDGGNAQILFEDNSGLTQNASITFDQAGDNTLSITTEYDSPNDLNKIKLVPGGEVAMTLSGGDDSTGTNGSITFNGYVGTRQTGTPTYLLGTDASGNIVKTNTVPGSGAGPYLPLTAGSGFPLTGDLHLGTFNKISGVTGDNLVIGVDINNSSGASSFDIQMDGSTSAFYINNSRQVGIGTTSIANAKLKVSGGGVDIESATDSLRLRFYEGAAFKSGIQQVLSVGEMITASAVGDMAIRANAGNLLFATGGSTERMRIDSSGKVGIGTDLPSEKLDVNGNVKIKDALLSNQENTDIDSAAAEVVAQVSTTYTAAFFDFVVKKGTNVRSGTVYACHDGTNVEFTETSTNDLGDTSDVTLSVDKTSTNLRLIATVTSDDWSVKSLIRAI